MILCNLLESMCACQCLIQFQSAAAALLGHARAACTSNSLRFLAQSCTRIKLAAVMNPEVWEEDMLRGAYQKAYEHNPRIVNCNNIKKKNRFCITKLIIKILMEYSSVGSQTTHYFFQTTIFISFMSFYFHSSMPQYLFRDLGFKSCYYQDSSFKAVKIWWTSSNNHSIFILQVYKITELNCFCLMIFVSSGCVWGVLSRFSP